MEVHLTPDQEAFVRQAIESGRLHRPEDAVEEALRLWEERERRRVETLTDADVGENDAVRSAESLISHGPAPSSPAGFKHSECSSSRVRPDVFRGESRAFLWLLDRCPMATSRQRLELSALDPLRKPLRRSRRGDRIFFAGHNEGRAV